MIKNDFKKIIARRKKFLKREEAQIDDLREIIDSMLACYQETIDFLAMATREETAIALEGVTAFVRKYPKQQIIEVCKKKIMQYRDLQKHCKIDITDTMREIEGYVKIYSQKKMTFKEALTQQLEQRKQTLRFDVNADFDWIEEESLENLILQDFEETKKQLKEATREEAAFAILALDNLLDRLSTAQARELVDIFKQKGAEFSDIQEYCEYDYAEQIKAAERCLKES